MMKNEIEDCIYNCEEERERNVKWVFPRRRHRFIEDSYGNKFAWSETDTAYVGVNLRSIFVESSQKGRIVN